MSDETALAPEIPEDIGDQHHSTRIALANQLLPGDQKVSSAAEADEVIAAEQARRQVSPDDRVTADAANDPWAELKDWVRRELELHKAGHSQQSREQMNP